METDLRISICQTDIVWNDKVINLNNAISLIESSEQSDLYIFPEMFSTGFTMTPHELAETNVGSTISVLQNTANNKKSAICGSFVAKGTRTLKFFNRFFLVSSTTKPFFYNKRHLFKMAGEDKVYQQGKTNTPINYKSWSILPIICYDLRFPVWCRNSCNYDLIICPANWPAVREDAWLTLLKARAIENQCYVVGVNRTGDDPNGNHYNGRSIVYSPKGEVLLDAGNKEGLHSISLSRKALTNFREKFSVLKDQDTFNIL